MLNYQINTYQDTFFIYELKEENTRSRVTVCPERGGIVLSYESDGQEFLYLDKATFVDPEANIRGGIPVLFPISGQLPEGKYDWDGNPYRIKNHGFARNLPWEVVGTSTSGQASLTLRLTSSKDTLESYPFDFELLFTYKLKDGKLRIEQEYRNLSDRPMPMYPGFHPYFAMEQGSVRYDTSATRQLDYNDGTVKPFTGEIDLSDKQESVILLDAAVPEISWDTADGARIGMTYSSNFRYVVIWTVPGKPFLCVEPWMAKNGEMQRKEELVMVEPYGAEIADLTIIGRIR